MKLAYDLRGEGSRTLMLLHGFTGSRETWSGLEPRLCTNFRLLRVDLPGHGGSPLPVLPGREGFLETVEALVDVLDELGLGQCDVAGYSQGARIALAFALEHPERVCRVVLESGTAGLHRRKERVARRREDERLAQRVLNEGVERFVSEWELLPLFAGLRRLPAPEQDALRTRRAGHSGEGLAGALRCLGLGVQPDYWPRLWKLLRPTLLLTGAEDAKFREIARRMAAELPIVWSHSFEGIGHAPHLEAPEAWAREVISFLETPWFDQQELRAP